VESYIKSVYGKIYKEDLFTLPNNIRRIWNPCLDGIRELYPCNVVRVKRYILTRFVAERMVSGGALALVRFSVNTAKKEKKTYMEFNNKKINIYNTNAVLCAINNVDYVEPANITGIYVSDYKKYKDYAQNIYVSNDNQYYDAQKTRESGELHIAKACNYQGSQAVFGVTNNNPPFNYRSINILNIEKEKEAKQEKTNILKDGLYTTIFLQNDSMNVIDDINDELFIDKHDAIGYGAYSLDAEQKRFLSGIDELNNKLETEVLSRKYLIEKTKETIRNINRMISNFEEEGIKEIPRFAGSNDNQEDDAIGDDDHGGTDDGGTDDGGSYDAYGGATVRVYDDVFYCKDLAGKNCAEYLSEYVMDHEDIAMLQSMRSQQSMQNFILYKARSGKIRKRIKSNC
jgi:hypothetical protein